jgi:ABC-type transporter MlaC component
MSFAMKINGRSEAVKLHAKAAWIALLLVLLAVPAAAQPARPAPKEATEPVMKQLEAFRRGDFDTAYTFASADIRQQFDRPAFEQMVRGGYPEIAESSFATVVSSAIAADGHAYVAVKVRGANGKDIEAFYELVLESGQWKINGVAAKPDPGVVVIPRPSGERAG